MTHIGPKGSPPSFNLALTTRIGPKGSLYRHRYPYRFFMTAQNYPDLLNTHQDSSVVTKTTTTPIGSKVLTMPPYDSHRVPPKGSPPSSNLALTTRI